MLIIFEDEYEETLHTVEDIIVPRIGDTVVFDTGEEWQVAGVRWRTSITDSKKFTSATVSVIHVDDVRSPVAENKVDHTGRINQLNNAIIEANKRLADVEKTHKGLREELVTVRQHIKRNTPKKDPNVGN